MKSEEFFEVIGNIDDDLIEEAGKFRKNNIRKFIVKWGALAACFAIVTVLSMQVLDKYGTENSDIVIEQGATLMGEGETTGEEPATEEPSGSRPKTEGTTGNTPVTEVSPEEKPVTKEPSNSETGGTAPEKEGMQPEIQQPENEDTPPFWGFMPDDTVTADEIYGGDYIDENGNHIVYIIEDTSENRRNIAAWLGVSESDLVFKTGKYTYSYLMNLNGTILEKMLNGEISFIMSTSVMEESNCVKVEVTTRDEAELDLIRSLDTIGGAIIFKYIE